MNRRAIISIILIVLSSSVPAFSAEERELLYPDYMNFEFTSGLNWNIGFNRGRVSGSIKPESDGFDASDHGPNNELRVNFVPDAALGYTTEPFFFYAQVFTKDPVKIKVNKAGPLVNNVYDFLTVDYTNTSIETSNAFRGSNDFSGYIVDESQLGSEAFLIPRPYSREICLVVTGDENIEKIMSAPSGSYFTATVEILVETVV